jgi:hypothetical protein
MATLLRIPGAIEAEQRAASLNYQQRQEFGRAQVRGAIQAGLIGLSDSMITYKGKSQEINDRLLTHLHSYAIDIQRNLETKVKPITPESERLKQATLSINGRPTVHRAELVKSILTRYVGSTVYEEFKRTEKYLAQLEKHYAHLLTPLPSQPTPSNAPQGGAQ